MVSESIAAALGQMAAHKQRLADSGRYEEAKVARADEEALRALLGRAAAARERKNTALLRDDLDGASALRLGWLRSQLLQRRCHNRCSSLVRAELEKVWFDAHSVCRRFCSNTDEPLALASGPGVLASLRHVVLFARTRATDEDEAEEDRGAADLREAFALREARERPSTARSVSLQSLADMLASRPAAQPPPELQQRVFAPELEADMCDEAWEGDEGEGRGALPLAVPEGPAESSLLEQVQPLSPANKQGVCARRATLAALCVCSCPPWPRVQTRALCLS